MKVIDLGLAGVKLLTPRRFEDERGHFSETYSRRAMADCGIDDLSIQQNLSFSREAGTLRGLHYQRAPMAQSKLVRVVRGRIFDVAVDVRPGSNSYGRYVGVELSAESGTQIYIPKGCLHGFLTLESATEVSYQVDAYYSPADEGSVRFDDPDIGIAWPFADHGLDPARVILSGKDRVAPRLRDSALGF